MATSASKCIRINPFFHYSIFTSMTTYWLPNVYFMSSLFHTVQYANTGPSRKILGQTASIAFASYSIKSGFIRKGMGNHGLSLLGYLRYNYMKIFINN